MEITRETVLPLDRDAAWRTVSDLERWIAETADVDVEPGAEGELTLPGGETRWTTIEDVCENERLSFWWHAPDALATFVEVELTDAVAGTRVVVTESGYAGSPICGSPWAGGASSGPRALSAAAGTASPRYAVGVAWSVRAIDWEPALARLGGEPLRGSLGSSLRELPACAA